MSRGYPGLGVSLGRRPAGFSWGRCGWLTGWAGDLGAPDVVAGRGSPSSPSLSSAPLLPVSLADAAARGGGSSRGTCGRERGVTAWDSGGFSSLSSSPLYSQCGAADTKDL